MSFSAYMLSPQFVLININDSLQLNSEELQQGLQFLEKHFTLNFISIYMKFVAKIFPFVGNISKKEVITSMTSAEWWKAVSKDADLKIGDNDNIVLKNVLSSIASSAGIERVFSTFGLVHSDLRNSLGIDKAGKLTFLMQKLNV